MQIIVRIFVLYTKFLFCQLVHLIFSHFSDIIILFRKSEIFFYWRLCYEQDQSLASLGTERPHSGGGGQNQERCLERVLS